MDYRLTQTGQEVQQILDQASTAYTKQEIDELVAQYGGVTVLDRSEAVDPAQLYEDITAGKPVVLIDEDFYLSLATYLLGTQAETGTHVVTYMLFVDPYIDPADGVETLEYFTWDISDGWSAGETALATTSQLNGKQDKLTNGFVVQVVDESGGSSGTLHKLQLKNEDDGVVNVIVGSTDRYSGWNQGGDTRLATIGLIKDKLSEGLATKQNTITDLQAIRNGAAAGATAVQPGTLESKLAGKQDVIDDLSTIRSGAAAGATAVQPATLASDLATKQDVINDLTTIRSGAAAGATAADNTGDKAYDAADFSGLGRVNLQKNIVDVSGTDKNVLTQAMVNTANTIYIIQYDYDLNGQTITVPAGCVLEFNGGSLNNGTLVSTETQIEAAPTKIFSGITFVGFNNVFEARWFVSKVNKDVLDTPLYDCSAELNYALNSGISTLHFSNDIYYVASTLQVQKNVALTGDMHEIETFAAWNDPQRPNILANNNFRGIYTNQGTTIIEYGYDGNLNKELSIRGVNFITDYYTFDDTYDNTIPVVKINAASVWGLEIDGSIVSMTKSQVPRGTGLLLTCYNASGYIADTIVRGSISGFDKCVHTNNNGGWINGVQLLCVLNGYQGCTGNGNSILARGVFQAAGSKEDNNDAFFELENRFILESLVYDINGGGRVKYAVKREFADDFTDIATSYNPNYHCINRGIKKTFKFLDFLQNSTLRKCLNKATITSRLYNNDTDEDISHVLNNVGEFCTLDSDVFSMGTNIDMNDGNAFSADVLDYVAFNLTLTTNTNELLLGQIPSYFVYLYREYTGNSQAFKYLDIVIKNNSNQVLLTKANIELKHNGWEVLDIIQEKIIAYAGSKYTFDLTWHGLKDTTANVYIGAIGICNFLGNSPNVSNIDVYKNAAVNQITPLYPSDKSIFYNPLLSRSIASHNWKRVYIGTLTSVNNNDACFLNGVISREGIIYTSRFELYVYVSSGNATFQVRSDLGSDANNNQVEFEYELTTSGTKKIYDLYFNLKGPSTMTYITITELRQMTYSGFTFEYLYAYDHAPTGTPTLAAYIGISGNSTQTNNVIASNAYAPNTLWYDKDNKRNLRFVGTTLGWIDLATGVSASIKKSGTFAQKPSSTDIYVGYQYFCTDKQTTEGATDGIVIYHKGSDVWVDALGRTIT